MMKNSRALDIPMPHPSSRSVLECGGRARPSVRRHRFRWLFNLRMHQCLRKRCGAALPTALQDASRLSRVITLVAIVLSLAVPLLAQVQAPAQPKQKLEKLPYPEILPPIAPAPPTSWWLTIWVTLALLALLGLVLCLLFWRRAETAEESVPPLRVALAGLDALQKDVETLPPSEVAHQVSVILRHYLQARYAVPAISRTTQELYGDHAIQAKEGMRERFGPVAECYDRLEFAPQPSTPAQCVQLIEQARHALQDEKRYASSPFPQSLSDLPPSVPYVPTKL
jgi:hypothetical protein